MATITLNRPEKRNALSDKLTPALRQTLLELDTDTAVRCVVITGAGTAFCAGGDISTMKDLDAEAGRARMRAGHQLVRLMAYAEKPLIAAVEGYAMGAGAGMALWCDTIVAGASARVGFPFFRVGLVPDYGITFTLPRRVGEGRARRILLNAETLTAEAALSAGLVEEVVPDEEVQARAVALATEMARHPATAVALTKGLLNGAPGELETVLEKEALSQGVCMATDNHKEGVAAFREKRAPNFK